MEELYEKSINMLRLYIKTVKNVPSEHQWNNFAIQEKILSSKSIEYYSHTKFNKLCRKVMKKSR